MSFVSQRSRRNIRWSRGYSLRKESYAQQNESRQKHGKHSGLRRFRMRERLCRLKIEKRLCRPSRLRMKPKYQHHHNESPFWMNLPPRSIHSERETEYHFEILVRPTPRECPADDYSEYEPTCRPENRHAPSRLKLNMRTESYS